MKGSVALVILIIMACLSCHNEEAVGIDAKEMADTTTYTRVQWMDSVVNFGSIPMGEQAQVAFRFRNTGAKPLYIANVRAGCGCTVADYTKGAIAPGGEGVVTGAFDSNKSHPGEVRKNIFVTTNTKNGKDHTLIFTGLIKEKARAN